MHRHRFSQDLRRQVTNEAPRIAGSIWSRRGLCPRHPFYLVQATGNPEVEVSPSVAARLKTTGFTGGRNMLVRWHKFRHSRKSRLQRCLVSFWCERGDSNPHGFTRQILSLVRLPIPPLSHLFSVFYIHCFWRKQIEGVFEGTEMPPRHIPAEIRAARHACTSVSSSPSLYPV